MTTEDDILTRAEHYVLRFSDICIERGKALSEVEASARAEIMGQWVAAHALLRLTSALAYKSGLTDADIEAFEPALDSVLRLVPKK
jgi:hypothetical protein